MILPVPDAPVPVARAARTVLVVDVVEFVRLMEQDEADTVLRCETLFQAFEADLLPRFQGRLVKSLGDGMMIEFDGVPTAVDCAQRMHRLAREHSTGQPPHRQIWLRAAATFGDVYQAGHDIQGRAVNLAARLNVLAGPGETVLSAEVRDRLVPVLDAEPEDLGDCYLKHMPAAVRAYRLRPLAEAHATPQLPSQAASLKAGVAVLPFVHRLTDPALAPLGDLLAGEVSAALSRTDHLQVISRLSCAAVAGRGLAVSDMGRALGAAYIVSGSFLVTQGRVRLQVELARAQDQVVLWTETLTGLMDDVLAGQDPIVPAVVAHVGDVIVQQELSRSTGVPLPNLQSHSLLMAGIGLIHRSSQQDYARAREILDHLAQRHPRLPQANAWLGKWHAMRLVQGLSPDPNGEAERALDCTQRALAADPRSSLALTMKGLVQGFMFKDLGAAEQCYLGALAANPNEALAWMYLGTLRAWQGRGEDAWTSASRGMVLSPLDPMRYYFDTMAAFAALAAQRPEQAASLAQRSLRANRLHTATHRTLVIAQWLLGDEAGARQTMAEMTRLEPGFSVARYRERFPGGQNDMSREYARILRAAGAAE